MNSAHVKSLPALRSVLSLLAFAAAGAISPAEAAPESSSTLSPAQRAREMIRRGEHRGTTRGLALGYVQCNLVIVPQADAYAFLLYCQRNQRACPVIEVLDTGSWEPKLSAP